MNVAIHWAALLMLVISVFVSAGAVAEEQDTIDNISQSVYDDNLSDRQEGEVLVRIKDRGDFLQGLRPGADAPPETSSFLLLLSRVAANPEVEITLGLVERSGKLMTGDGRAVQSIYLSTRSCSTYCRPDEPGVLKHFDLKPWVKVGAEAPARGTNIKDSTGICGELSVAHGLTDRTVVDPKWPDIVSKENWHDGYVERVWKQAGSNTNGTTIGEQKAAFRADWNSVWYNRCYATRVPKSGFLGLGRVTVGDWCRNLQEHVQEKNDACVFGVNGGGAKRHAAHAMYVLDAQWDETDDTCTIRTVDTGSQGTPTGRNVPRDPGMQVWSVGGTPSNQSIRYIAGNSAAFWNGMNYQTVDSFCCDEEEKWRPSRPERPGSALK